MGHDGITTRDGRRLAYSRLGSGPTIVCHPGGPGFGGGVLSDLGGLDRYYELIRMDPRGTGDSDRTGDDDYELQAYAEDLADLVASLDRRPAAVLGHSHGGLVALTYAAANPDAIDRLVIVDTPSHLTGSTTDEPDAPDEAVEMGSGSGSSSVRRLLRLGPGGRDGGADGRDADRERDRTVLVDETEDDGMVTYGSPEGEYEPGLAEEGIHAAPLEYFNDHVLEDFDLRSVLRRVTVPTLIVCGRDDDLAGPAVSRVLARQLPDARLAVIEGSGHVPFLENPDAFRQAVVDHVGIAD